ncbi:transporter [Halalkalibacter wakoensis JCM 9140]|uniref:Transporter n=1 Tax=Halalkalibacter wakoensis JCM 9140 TaxID=1236970 RepID=W4Q1M0_9BACI|nr:DMT family transporter [Halalkalibacter wakoensis]GAE25623.1 transporter [Halalkalibacter wakoensis JCM 9140]
MNAKLFFTSPIGILLTACFVCFLWGSSFPLIKIAYEVFMIEDTDTYTQILFAGYRFFLASLLLFLFLYLKQRHIRYLQGSLPAIIQIGFFQTALQYLMLHVGVSMTSGIESSILTGSTTFFSIVIAHFMYVNDRLNWQKTIGLLFGFIGVVLATGNGSLGFSFGFGAIALLIAAMSNAMGGILAKNKAKKLHPLYLTTYQMLLGSLFLLTVGSVGSGFVPLTITKQSLGLLLYLAFVSAAGFFLWNTLMKYNNVGKISMYYFLIPVFGVIQSAWYLGETLNPIVFLSLLFVIIGILVVNKPENRAWTPVFVIRHWKEKFTRKVSTEKSYVK